jgi:hypothetical protein
LRGLGVGEESGGGPSLKGWFEFDSHDGVEYCIGWSNDPRHCFVDVGLLNDLAGRFPVHFLY